MKIVCLLISMLLFLIPVEVYAQEPTRYGADKLVNQKLGITISLDQGDSKQLSRWMRGLSDKSLAKHIFKLDNDTVDTGQEFLSKLRILFEVAEGVGIVVPSEQTYLYKVKVLKGRAGHQKYYRGNKYAHSGEVVAYELYRGSDNIVLGAPKEGDIVLWFPMSDKINSYGWIKLLEPDNREQVVSYLTKDDKRHVSFNHDSQISASDYRSNGISYYNNKNYKQALDLFIKGATNDDLFCNYMIGKMYIEGKGVPKNIDKGLMYLKKPAEIGHVLSLKLYCKYAGEAMNGTEIEYNCREAGF